MRKICVYLVSVILSVTLISCGGGKSKPKSSVETDSVSVSSDKLKSETSTEGKKSDIDINKVDVKVAVDAYKALLVKYAEIRTTESNDKESTKVKLKEYKSILSSKLEKNELTAFSKLTEIATRLEEGKNVDVNAAVAEFDKAYAQIKEAANKVKDQAKQVKGQVDESKNAMKSAKDAMKSLPSGF